MNIWEMIDAILDRIVAYKFYWQMIGEMQIPVRKVMPRQDDVRQKVGGSNVGAGK